MAKENVFIKKTEEAAEPAPEKPKRTRKAKTPAKTQDATGLEVQKLCLRIVEGELDDHLLTIAEAMDQRRDVLKEKVAAAVRAVYGEDYIVTKPGSHASSAQPNPFIAKAQERGEVPQRHPNEVDLTGFAADGLPQLDQGYGSPSIMDTGGAVSAAVDVIGAGDGGDSEIFSTGAQIG